MGRRGSDRRNASWQTSRTDSSRLSARSWTTASRCAKTERSTKGRRTHCVGRWQMAWVERREPWYRIERISTRTPWVDSYGYSRAVRSGMLIEVSGTTAIGPDGEPVAPGDAYQQSRYAFEIIGTALANLGASFEDVVRTRVFLRNIEDWRE